MESQLQEITQKIVREFQPEKIILFGSWAWGKPKRWSDVDLFIVKDGKKTPIEMMREVGRIIFEKPFPTDILVYTSKQTRRRLILGDPFLKKIFAQGKVLYAKK